MHLLPIPPFVSVAFAALAIAFLAPSASAQGLKIIVAPELAGGEVFVEGLLHLRFVGPASTPAMRRRVSPSGSGGAISSSRTATSSAAAGTIGKM